MLNRHNLTIAKLASTDRTRYSLNRIRISPDRTEVTNGHYAVTVTTPKLSAESFPSREGTPAAVDQFEPFTIAADSALKAVKGHPQGTRKCTIPILSATGVAITAEGNPALVATDLEQVQVTEVRDHKGTTFPDMDRVFPKLENATFAMELDAKYLLALLQTVVDFKGKPKRGAASVTVRICENGCRTFNLSATNDEGQELRAVLMPMKGEEEKWEEAQKAKRDAETAAYEAEQAERAKQYAPASAAMEAEAVA